MNSFFPATYSTLHPEALAAFLSERFGFQDLFCNLIVRGVSDTYLIRSETEKFIFRIYRSSHRNLSQIRAETELLSQCRNANVPVSYPIADLAGTFIQQMNAVEGTRYGVLFSFAPGKVEQKWSEAQLQRIGHGMAAFHNVSSRVVNEGTRGDLNFQTTLFDPLKKLKPYFESIQSEYEWWMNTAETVCSKLNTLDTIAFSSGFCQFDFLPKNFHFQGDSVTFFDFDFLGHGWLAFDLMTFWQNFVLDVHYTRMSQAEADNSFGIFLGAYREIRSFSAEEERAIPYLYPCFWLFYMGFHTSHDQFYEFVKPDVLKFRTGVLKPVIEKYLVV